MFTDSGTYRLPRVRDRSGRHVPALKIVTEDNTANAPGGQNELINYFHGYIINPNKPKQTVNLPAAQDFLNYITSPAVQAQVGAYLASQGIRSSRRRRHCSATPKIPAKFVARGGEDHGYGNADQRTARIPALNSEPVNVSKIVTACRYRWHGKTDSSGDYSISFVPPTTAPTRSPPTRSRRLRSRLSAPCSGICSHRPRRRR